MPNSIRYSFSQQFTVTAQQAFRWCTDFSPQDPKLMGLDGALREVIQVSEGTVVLKETYPTNGGTVVKEKLVQLYPGRHMWTSTHLSGPNRHSQFIYEIQPEGTEASRLDFTACHLEYKDQMTPQEAEELAGQLRSFDMEVWRRLASALHKDLKPQRRLFWLGNGKF